MLLRKFLENWIVYSGIKGKIDHNCLQLFNLEQWGIYEKLLTSRNFIEKGKAGQNIC